jgi:hypothetical protein
MLIVENKCFRFVGGVSRKSLEISTHIYWFLGQRPFLPPNPVHPVNPVKSSVPFFEIYVFYAFCG